MIPYKLKNLVWFPLALSFCISVHDGNFSPPRDRTLNEEADPRTVSLTVTGLNLLSSAGVH